MIQSLLKMSLLRTATRPLRTVKRSLRTATRLFNTATPRLRGFIAYASSTPIATTL